MRWSLPLPHQPPTYPPLPPSYDNSSCTSTQRSCYPCYCEGLLTTLTKSISLHDLVLMKSQCSPYLQDLTLQVAVQARRGRGGRGG